MSTATRTPRYLQIADYIRGLVAEGTPGTRLPPEITLCEMFGVSRMTVRQALQPLVADGLLHRRPGRGTFISARPVARPLHSLMSFTESMRQRGQRTTSRVLTAALAPVEPAEAQALGLPDAQPAVLLERLRLAGGVPMAIERAVLTADTAPVLDADLAGGSLHATLRRLGRVPTRADSRLSARPSTARERDLLDQGDDGVALCERKLIVDQHQVPLELTTTCYAAERYVFDLVMEQGTSATEPGTAKSSHDRHPA